MHPSLRLEKVLLRVCRELDDTSLAVLARTCRAFSSTALDVLYAAAELDTLVKCLPSDIWNSRLPSPSRGIFCQTVISRSLGDADWKTLIKYSSRVRQLSVVNGFGDVQIMEMLSGSSAHIDIFPRLSCVRIRFFVAEDTLPDEDTLSTCRFMRWLFRPTLTKLHLTLPAIMMKVLWDEAPLLGQTCPYLVKFDAYLSSYSGMSYLEYTHLFDQVICSLNPLQALDCSEVSQRTLQYIAKWPNLHTLSVLPPQSTPPLDLGPTPDQRCDPFPALRCLTVGGYTESITAFLNANTWNLDDLIVHFDWSTCIRSFGEMTRTLAAKVSAVRLKKLFFVVMSFKDPSLEAIPIVRMDDIKPFFVFHNVTHIDLTPRCIIDIDDEMVKCMALAWPNIRILTVKQYDKQYVPPKVTLTGLVSLIQHCPRLVTFCLAIDATVVPKDPLASPNTGVNDRITVIEIDDSPVESPGLVAAYLSAFMPRLKEIGSWADFKSRPMGPVEQGYREKWHLVARLVEAFTMVRSQEHTTYFDDDRSSISSSYVSSSD
ncbi:hypothetical protein F5I97DRAFT_1440431 [Phlebopus sp. FC_14]|nr:hypothetical protein F5I97DRAFT_1440431 [Phlebopus sp. FC_14]